MIGCGTSGTSPHQGTRDEGLQPRSALDEDRPVRGGADRLRDSNECFWSEGPTVTDNGWAVEQFTRVDLLRIFSSSPKP